MASDSITSGEGTYDPSHFSRLFAIEDRHFWFRTRKDIITTLASQITSGLPPGYRVLEVGCGTGNILRALEETCPCGFVVGMDLFAQGLRYARQRTSCPLVQGDMRMSPFGKQFDLIGLFDVLEHQADDQQMLRDVYTLLTLGGRLLLTVPAHPFLWSYFDKASKHCRRYKLSELERKLLGTGFQVEYLTQYMAVIFPLVWLWRWLAAVIDRRPAGDEARSHGLAGRELQIIPVINKMVGLLLAQEARLVARRFALPFGTSLLAIARKGA